MIIRAWPINRPSLPLKCNSCLNLNMNLRSGSFPKIHCCRNPFTRNLVGCVQETGDLIFLDLTVQFVFNIQQEYAQSFKCHTFIFYFLKLISVVYCDATFLGQFNKKCGWMVPNGPTISTVMRFLQFRIYIFALNKSTGNIWYVLE